MLGALGLLSCTIKLEIVGTVIVPLASPALCLDDLTLGLRHPPQEGAGLTGNVWEVERDAGRNASLLQTHVGLFM